MPRYPRLPLEEKLAWMRERQRTKEEEARRQQEAELRATLTTAAELHAQLARSPVLRAPASGRAGQKEIPPERKMWRVDEVAKMLAVSVRTVRRWFNGRAVIVPTGPHKTTVLISQKALDDWFREHTPASSR